MSSSPVFEVVVCSYGLLVPYFYTCIFIFLSADHTTNNDRPLTKEIDQKRIYFKLYYHTSDKSSCSNNFMTNVFLCYRTTSFVAPVSTIIVTVTFVRTGSASFARVTPTPRLTMWTGIWAEFTSRNIIDIITILLAFPKR